MNQTNQRNVLNKVCPISLGSLGCDPFVFSADKDKCYSYSKRSFEKYLVKKLDFRCPMTRKNINSDQIKRWNLKTFQRVELEIKAVYFHQLRLFFDRILPMLPVYIYGIQKKNDLSATEEFVLSSLAHILINRKGLYRRLKRDVLARNATDKSGTQVVQTLFDRLERMFSSSVLSISFDGYNIYPQVTNVNLP